VNYFGMVTTRHSHAYTEHALRSFFQTTPFGPDDRFFLIDNDGTYLPSCDNARITLLRNGQPVGFAANVNQVLRRAREQHADLFFLNNDLIFTAHWLDPLLIGLPVLLSPVSNAQQPFDVNGWKCGPALDLPDYLGHEGALGEVVRRHQATVRGYVPVLCLPFFCIKIPYTVQGAVGELDERFGAGGGEDWDYCLRCHLAGFRVLYALDAVVLHFMGKSTWRGAESRAQTLARQEIYHRAFREKWGPQLLETIEHDPGNGLPVDGRLAEEWRRGNFRRVVEQLQEPRGDPSMLL
jgi:hypothetical protein